MKPKLQACQDATIQAEPGFVGEPYFFLTWYTAPCYFGAICMTSGSLWYGRLTWTYNLNIRETNARHPDSVNANQLSGDTVGEPNSLTTMVQSEHFCHTSCINGISSAWNMLKRKTQRSARLAEIGLTNELKALAFRVKPASITSQALRKPLRTWTQKRFKQTNLNLPQVLRCSTINNQQQSTSTNINKKNHDMA